MASPHGEEDRAGAGAASSESFVAIDMESLLILASPIDEQSTPNSRIQMHKTLSRKGPYRAGGGAEKKAAEGGGATVFTAGGGAQVAEKSSTEQPGHVAGEQGSSSLPHGATPTGVLGRCRRNNSGKRSSAWLDPRRVVMLFATLSSMGTLILLYLTLSMGSRMVGGKANAQ